MAISIHALLAESDAEKYRDTQAIIEFLSTPSSRRATSHTPPCLRPAGISIHALLAESDGPSRSFLPGCRYFYPRPPRGERLSFGMLRPQTQEFLSTPSSRRATAQYDLRQQSQPISIHALLAESDPRTHENRLQRGDFYPRPPRGERPGAVLHFDSQKISIHALLAESDEWAAKYRVLPDDFYPRPPRGERLLQTGLSSISNRFLSTPSSRRATGFRGCVGHRDTDFYPRPPRGERHVSGSGGYTMDLISIHALLAESDRACRSLCTSPW